MVPACYGPEEFGDKLPPKQSNKMFPWNILDRSSAHSSLQLSERRHCCVFADRCLQFLGAYRKLKYDKLNFKQLQNVARVVRGAIYVLFIVLQF